MGDAKINSSKFLKPVNNYRNKASAIWGIKSVDFLQFNLDFTPQAKLEEAFISI